MYYPAFSLFPLISKQSPLINFKHLFPVIPLSNIWRLEFLSNDYTKLTKLVLSKIIQTSRFDPDIHLLHSDIVFHSVSLSCVSFSFFSFRKISAGTFLRTLVYNQVCTDVSALVYSIEQVSFLFYTCPFYTCL